jgi:acetyl-CoA carboxylase alpha subunit
MSRHSRALQELYQHIQDGEIGDIILMLENAWYSVISPEGCAAILWRDNARASDAAEALRLSAPDLLELRVIDKILPEPTGGAHRCRGLLGAHDRQGPKPSRG